MSNKKNKKLTFIAQSKGGVGKSLLTFILANKYPEFRFFDLDDATKTSTKHLKFAKVDFISLMSDETQSVQRANLDDFFQKIAKGSYENYVCDLGSNMSEQLPEYFNEVGLNDFADLLKSEFKIDFQIIVIIAGGSDFSSSADYLESLLKMCGNTINIKAYVNDYFPLNEVQKNELNALLKTYKNKNSVKHFTLTADRSPVTAKKIKAILTAGNGFVNADPILALKCRKNIQAIDIYD